jgi:hypothetical protein
LKVSPATRPSVVASKSKAPNVLAKSATFLFKSTFFFAKSTLFFLLNQHFCWLKQDFGWLNYQCSCIFSLISESGTTAPSRPAEPKPKAGVLEQLYERPIPCVDVGLSTKVTKVSIQVGIIP